LVTLFFFKACTLVECIRHELLKGGEELRVVSHLPCRWVDPAYLKHPLEKMALEQRLNIRHEAASALSSFLSYSADEIKRSSAGCH